MNLKTIFVFLLSTIVESQCETTSYSDILSDFLNFHYLSQVIIFNCGVSESYYKENSKFSSYHNIKKFHKKSLYEKENVMRLNHQHVGVFLNATCESIEEIFETLSTLNFFNSSYYWLIVTENWKYLEQILAPQNINLDSDITVAMKIDNNLYKIYDVYNPSLKYGGNLVTTEIGTWKSQTKFNETQSKTSSKLSKRRNLYGITIDAGVVVTGNKKLNQSFLEFLQSEEDPFIDAQHRHGFRLIQYLTEKHNFNISYHLASAWGILLSDNKTFNGIVGMFQKHQIEFSISPVRATLDRLDYIDVMVKTWVTTGTFVFRHPKNELRNYFLQPMKTIVWILILVMIVIISICITIAMRFSMKLRTANFMRSWIIVIGIVCQQGIIQNTSKLSMRIIFYISLIFSLVIYQYYSSFVVSSLLTDPPKTINTLSLLTESKLEIGIENFTYNKDFFDRSDDPIVKYLYNKKKIDGNSFIEPEEGVERMKNGGYAFHIDTSYGYRLIKDALNDEQICELQEVLLYPARILGMTVKKKSHFREFFNVGILRLKENGIYSYYTEKWATSKPACVKSIAKIKSVEMTDAYLIFAFLLISIMVSFGVLVFEIIHYRLINLKK